MCPDYSNQALINNIVGRIFIPIAQTTFTDVDLMRLANDALQDEVVSLIMSGREEYFVDHIDVTPTDGIIPIPPQAIGIKLRMVCVVQNGCITNLPLITLDVIAGWGNGYDNSGNGYTSGGYNVQGNNIHLYPSNMTINGQIRLYYYATPLVLAPPAEYGKILAIDTGTNTVTLDNLPLSWAAGTEVNGMDSQPNFKVTLALSEVVSVSQPDVVLTDITDLAVGNFLSEYGYSAVAQIPTQAHGYLAQLTGAKCLEGLGDKDACKLALEKAETLKKTVLTFITQRVDASPKKIVHSNGGLVGAMGFGSFGGRRRW